MVAGNGPDNNLYIQASLHAIWCVQQYRNVLRNICVFIGKDSGCARDDSISPAMGERERRLGNINVICADELDHFKRWGRKKEKEAFSGTYCSMSRFVTGLVVCLYFLIACEK